MVPSCRFLILPVLFWPELIWSFEFGLAFFCCSCICTTYNYIHNLYPILLLLLFFLYTCVVSHPVLISIPWHDTLSFIGPLDNCGDVPNQIFAKILLQPLSIYVKLCTYFLILNFYNTIWECLNHNKWIRPSKLELSWK